MKNTQANMILLAIWMASNCDFEKAYKMIMDRHIPTDEEMERAKNEDIENLVSILDIDYPKELKNSPKPPFIYKKGI